MLDIDFGDYPNVTSSNILPANVCLGLGIPHTFITKYLWRYKSLYNQSRWRRFSCTNKRSVVEKLFQKAGHEFGATTGRSRMCGWLDLFALRYAIKLFRR